MNAMLKSTLIILSFVLNLIAQENKNQIVQERDQKDEKQIDLLFNQIIQTIPEKNEPVGDSTGQSKIPEVQGAVYQNRESVQARQDQLLIELPEELRKQVEKAIVEIQNKKEERIPEFLENRKRP